MRLAAEGGEKLRARRFPSNGDASGRVIGGEERALLEEILRSGAFNRVGGTQVAAFESAFAALHGVPDAVASTSGTAAIHVAVGALNPEPGDEIIVAPITDMGSVYGIVAQNAIPRFADVDPLTYTISVETIEPLVTDRTRAIVPVHLFGQMADMDPILGLARKHGIVVIEDACQALLAEDHGRLAGTLGDFGCFSFQQSKHLTTGDGGMTLVSRPEQQRRARLFSDKGWPRDGSGREYEFLAPNYRMTEFQGAFGRAQLARMPRAVKRRREIADALSARLSALPGVSPPHVRPGAVHSWWLYTFTIDEERLGVAPADFARLASAEGLPVSSGYIGKPLFMYEALQKRAAYGSSAYPREGAGRATAYHAGECPNTWEALRRMILIPISEAYTDDDARDLGDGIAKVAEILAARR